tara:strand:- start:41 stop:226 length:186 start_codon:yes stop_codon:yes gene_type:complete
MGRLKKDEKKTKKTKEDLLIASKLKKVYPGMLGNDNTLKLLKRLGINPKDLTDGKYKYDGN